MNVYIDIQMYILGDPGAVSRVDKMFVVKVYCKIETSFLSTRLTAPGSPRMTNVPSFNFLHCVLTTELYLIE